MYFNWEKRNIVKVLRGVSLSFLSVSFIFSFIYVIYWLYPQNSLADNDFSKIPSELQAAIIQSQLQKYLNLDAKAAFSLKTSPSGNKVIFKKNEAEKLPIASLTKLMTALIVLENYNLEKKVIISDKSMAQEGEQGVLKLGEELSVKNLLYITLIESSNRAAYALSEVIGEGEFVNLMDLKAEKLGLFNTNFEGSTGLNSESYSTVEDLTKLSEYLFKNYPLFREIISLKEYDLYLPSGELHHKLVNTNHLLGEEGVVGGKTGWTNIARGCIMVIKEEKPEEYSIHVILGSEDRFSEMKKLITIF